MIKSFFLGVCFLFFMGAYMPNAKSIKTVTISGDNGGIISQYIQRFTKMEVNGVYLRIDGECMSACTMFTGIIDRNHVCVTPRAALGFHAAGYANGDGVVKDAHGKRLLSSSGTTLMMDFYPEDIKQWIGKHGGLSYDIIILRGSSLRQMFRSC